MNKLFIIMYFLLDLFLLLHENEIALFICYYLNNPTLGTSVNHNDDKELINKSKN